MSSVESEEAALASLMHAWIKGAEYADRIPVIRTGERQPIPAATRFLIHCRDNWRCRWCDFVADPKQRSTTRWLEVDHIIPWSAGGSDRSDNLRSMCNLCNTDRSNYVTDSGHARARACTVWCDPCFELALRASLYPDVWLDIEPWKLREYISPRWKALQIVGEFDLEMSADPHHVWCFYGNHVSWTAGTERLC